ncbi:DUF4181 domain-containing protein [Paenibacillus sp. EC2-1]|uniref:DUF4181 domain-containing protein n=1 Tax=Paenibacillus sp. EC2-1 TaxID=3388665 RepID=UPI003BEEC773
MSPAISIFPLFLVIIQIVLRSKIVPKDTEKLYDTAGKHLYIWGGIIFASIALTIYFNLDFLDENNTKWFWLIMIVTVLGYNSFLYWKFIRESNEHIVSLITLIVGIVYILIFIF